MSAESKAEPTPEGLAVSPSKGRKVCSMCREEKPLSEFYEHPETRDGRRGACKECTKAYARAYQRRQREELVVPEPACPEPVEGA